MKKLLSIILAGAIVMALMTGCEKNNGDEGNKNSTETVSNEKNKNITDIKSYASEIKASADKLSEYMEDGLKKGYVDQARMDEYKSICERLDQIINNPEDTEEIKSELDLIKNNITVMASQCAAPNDVVDSLISVNGENVTVESRSENENVSEKTEELKPLSNDMTQLIDDYTLLQNEASQNVDKGEISEEDYMTLIKDGTNLAALKEEMELKGESDDLNKRIGECKNRIHDIAVKMGSELSSKFE